MYVYSIQETKYAVMKQGAKSEEKLLTEMTTEELINLVYGLQNAFDKLHAEKEAVVQTMNKFLAKDHEDALQKLLEYHDQTLPKY